MKLSPLNNIYTQRDIQSEFRGYNHRLYLDSSEFYDMGNMTSAYYPVLSPRNKRGYIMQLDKPNGIFPKTKLCYVNGTHFYYNGISNADWLVSDTEKQFVSMGGYVLIFPDKKVFNTATLTMSDMEASFTTSGTVTYKLSRQDGTIYPDPVVSDTEPEEPSDGDLWINTSGSKHILEQYSAFSEQWTQIATVYVRIENPGIGAAFNQYDGVSISGSTIDDLNHTAIIQSKANDWIVVVGLIDGVMTQSTALTLERKTPDMDFLTEHNNRVWGCSSVNHEIYCCKQGDPTNWYAYEGLSTDSYAVTIASDGDFTGAVTYLDYVLFFKENRVHIIQGNKPANFQAQDRALRGVEKGSEKSMAIVNEILYYKSNEGIVAYGGSLPETIYASFGDIRYKNAVAGVGRNKYYVSMQSIDDNEYYLFAYDTEQHIWHKEDNLQVKYFCKYNNELYYIDKDNKIGSIYGSTEFYDDFQGGSKEDKVTWFVETGDFGMESPDQKTISRILLRLSAEPLTSISVSAMYDSSGEWENKRTIRASSKHAFNVPVIPRRCDHMRLRIEGEGAAKIWSLSKETEGGSELNGSF